MDSLYRELGGSNGLEALVDSLYRRVLADARLAPFFDGIDMAVQRRKFRMFLHTVTGGPQARSAIELRSSHAASVDKGLSSEHFTAFLGHFEHALAECNVPPGVAGEVMEHVSRTRDDVLGM